MVTLLHAHMPHWCACHRFKESVEQELKRSWTTHELWFHQPSVPTTIVRRKFKILDATGGPQQRNSYWKLLISKLALSPLLFQELPHIQLLGFCFHVFVEVNMVAPVVAPLVAKKQLETLPIWSHSPLHWGPPGGEVTGGRWAKATWGFNRKKGRFSHVNNVRTQRLTSNNLQIKVRVTSDLNHLQGGQFRYKTIFITFQDPKNHTKFYLIRLVGSWTCLGAPPKKHGQKRVTKLW